MAEYLLTFFNPMKLLIINVIASKNSENFLESSPFFSPCGEIYGLVHVGRQPECEICGEKKDQKYNEEKKEHDPIFVMPIL